MSNPEHDGVSESNLSESIQDVLAVTPSGDPPPQPLPEVVHNVKTLLNLTFAQAEFLVAETERLYINRMRERFSQLRVSARIKRTNPFLLRIRGARTVRDWATLQVQSALYASEEEAVGHLLEAIAKICFPGGAVPTYPDDFDLEVQGPGEEVHGYQIKMSWDCMPMSSRKNLSNTIRLVRAAYEKNGKQFIGFFAPCYGRATTSKADGQEYITLASREFWARVGGGDGDFDVRVGEVCSLLCSKFRREILDTLVPDLLGKLTDAALPQIGTETGDLDYTRLFRRINK